MRLSKISAEIADLLKATTVGFAGIALFGALVHIRMLTAPFLLLFWAINFGLLCTSRVVPRIVLARVRRHGMDLRYLLIFGTNPRAVAFARAVAANPDRGYRLVGFVDDEWPGMTAFNESGFRIVSNYVGLKDFLRHSVVDEAVIYLPFEALYHHWSTVASLCAHHGITVRLNSDTFGLRNAHWLREEIDGGHYIATHTGVGEGWPLVAKRALDIAMSALLLLYSSLRF